jgi:5-methylthioadenosine/S-adenosylhomocysteine deaminase
MVSATAEKLALPISIHVAETHDEVSLFLRGEGPLAVVRRAVRLPAPDPKRTPLRYLDECGLLGPRTLLIHGVHLSDSDLDIIAQRGCALVTCPTSNAKLGSGIARVGAWHRRKIPVCIATDSPASGESFDLFEEMRRFVLLQRALTGETEGLSAEDVLQMVTVNPAKALGMQDLVGSIRNGLSADFVLVDPDRKHVSPNRDIYGTLLWGTTSQDIVSVRADGREVYRR